MADPNNNLDNNDDIDNIDDIDDIDYNLDQNANNELDLDIEEAIKMSLNDINHEYSKVMSIFNQYISADDEIKNYMLEGLSENELIEMFNMIENHNKETQRHQEQLERQMIIQLQDEEFNKSLLEDMEKDKNKEKEIMNDDSFQSTVDDSIEKNVEEEVKPNENLQEEIRKKRLEFYSKSNSSN